MKKWGVTSSLNVDKGKLCYYYIKGGYEVLKIKNNNL